MSSTCLDVGPVTMALAELRVFIHHSTTLAAATFCVAALICAPVLLVLPLGWLVGVQAWAGVVFLGLGATGLAYALYTWGLTRISASGAVTLPVTLSTTPDAAGNSIYIFTDDGVVAGAPE